MLSVLLFCSMLFQAGSQTELKPAIENDRVAVYDIKGVATTPASDTVIVALAGRMANTATFHSKTTPLTINGRFIVIDLKDHPVPPIANTSGYPLAFPRPGVTKIVENDRVIVWDYTWTPDVPTPMHFHDKDVVVVFLEDGDLKSTTPDGQAVSLPTRQERSDSTLATARTRKIWSAVSSTRS